MRDETENCRVGDKFPYDGFMIVTIVRITEKEVQRSQGLYGNNSSTIVAIVAGTNRKILFSLGCAMLMSLACQAVRE